MNLSNYILEYDDGSSASVHTYEKYEDARNAAISIARLAGLKVQVIVQEFEYSDSSLVWDTEEN